MSSIGQVEPGTKHRRLAGIVTVVITAVVAVLDSGCATTGSAGAGSAGAGPSAASPAPSPVRTGAGYAPSGGPGGIAAVAALSESDAWAVGVHEPLPKGIYPMTWHWDGKRWTVVPCPSPVTGEPVRSELVAVAIDAPDDAWAVGDWSPIERHAPTYALIEHWNGTRWSMVPAPPPPGHTTTGGIIAVTAISPTAAWAFGDGGIIRWDGTRWRFLTRLPRHGLGTQWSGMAVISARDIWIVGTVGVTKFRALAAHWDGSKWTSVPTPLAINGWTRKTILQAVAGSSASNIWAVGWYQSGPTGQDYSTLVEHWDGTRWQVQPSPDGPGSGTESQLFGVAALSRTSAWAVGDSSGPVPLIEHWNGAHWSAMRSRLQPHQTDTALYHVVAVDPRYAWAWGDLLEKWNGTSWQQVRSPKP